MKYNEVIKRHLNINKKRTGKKLDFRWITVHNTGNPKSSADNERRWLDNPENTTSTGWHIVVDGKEAIEAVPLDEIAYHAGTGEGNSTSIGIEICDSAGAAAEKQAVELIADLLIRKNWGIDKVRTHKSWSGKICPHLILPRWNQFTQNIEEEIKKQKSLYGADGSSKKEIELFDKSGNLLGKIIL